MTAVSLLFNLLISVTSLHGEEGLHLEVDATSLENKHEEICDQWQQLTGNK